MTAAVPVCRGGHTRGFHRSLMSDTPCGFVVDNGESGQGVITCQCQAFETEVEVEPKRVAEELDGGFDQIASWWREIAEAEIQAVVPKAIEYGAGDLREIGRQLRESGAGDQSTDEGDVELGIYFYVVGKLARWSDAIRTGRKVSDDTLHDLGVYVRMAQRNRAAGGWPGLKEEQ